MGVLGFGRQALSVKLPDENVDAGDEAVFRDNDENDCGCNDDDKHDDYACNAHARDNSDHGDDANVVSVDDAEQNQVVVAD